MRIEIKYFFKLKRRRSSNPVPIFRFVVYIYILFRVSLYFIFFFFYQQQQQQQQQQENGNKAIIFIFFMMQQQ